MKKFTLISGIVAVMFTTALADFSFSKIYEELKAVAEATDVNLSNLKKFNESNSTNSTTTIVVDSNSTDINSSNGEASLDENVSDENKTETSSK